VTGGAGYIGAVLVPALLADHHVTVLDNFRHGENSLSQWCIEDDFDVVNGDCRDSRTVLPLLRKADVIMPLAAIVGAPACDKDQRAAMTTNYEAVRMICDYASTDQQIIFPNSNSGYGTSKSGEECTEESPLRPLSLYGREKVRAEETVLRRKNSISLRLATVFGASPRMRLDLLTNDFVYRALNDRVVVVFEGHFKRNYIHTRDVAGAFIHALHNFDVMKGNAFNIGLSDANLSKLELCEAIKQHIPEFVYMESPIGKDIDQRNYLISNKKAEATGWKPCYTLDDGIRELIKLFRTIKNAKYCNA